MSVVAKNLIRIIREKGLKNKSVAAKAGYTEAMFSSLLHGRKSIKDTDIAKLASALEIEPNDLFASNTTD